MRVDEIIPRLFISARTHQLSDQEKLALVNLYQLTTVVNLWHTPDVVIRNAVATYVHCSIPDGKRVPQGLIDLGRRIVAIYNRGDEQILVHCYGGRNRAALLVGLVVHRVLGVSGDDLILFIQKRRRGALKNTVFADWLRWGSLGGWQDDHQHTGNLGIG